MTKITLPWMNKLRKRLEEEIPVQQGSNLYLYKHIPVLRAFIKPIMEYGEAEEKRISEAFKDENV